MRIMEQIAHQRSLGAAGRAVEQQASRRCQPQPEKCVAVAQRPLGGLGKKVDGRVWSETPNPHLHQRLLDVVQPANVFPAGGGGADLE